MIDLLPHADFIYSAIIGVVISIALIKLGSGPALFPTSIADDSSLSTDVDVVPSQVSVPGIEYVPVTEINKNYALKKLAPIQNILGLSKEQMEEAINSTNNEMKESCANTLDTAAKLDAASNMSSITDTVVLLVGLLFGFYVINTFSHGDFGRMIYGMFPDELDSLKLKDYLEKLHMFK